MKVLGIVQWTNRDKSGNPFAGVRPLVEIQKTEWRQIYAVEEFPSQGQVFWPNAQAAEGALITFRPESNPGHKDKCKVVEPRTVLEALDLRRFGTPTDVRAALATGIQLPSPIGAVRALVWCKPDVLVGPVELTRVATGRVKLSGTNLARVPLSTGTQLHPIMVNGHERLVRVDDVAPSGYVDWDDDATVLRRALEAAVRIAKQAGRDTGQTKKQIEDAARALAAQGLGLDAQLDRYRLERALALCADTGAVGNLAPKFVELLREHPAIKATLDELSARVRADVEQSARVEIEQRLAREHAALKEATDALARTRSELAAGERELHKLNGELDAVHSKTKTAMKDAEAAIDARVLAALDRPLDLLAEVSVLRPLLGGRTGRSVDAPAPEKNSPINWSHTRGESIKDRTGLQRALTSAARARGVEPSLMLQLHAAVAARLMPVALGPGALAVLAAYAHAACGGRLSVLHMSPGVLQPRDLDEAPGGLVAAIEAAKEIDGISLVVFEGANRSPLEASVVPLLQLSDIALTGVASTPSVRLAATLVVGATTVPVTSQVWSHAVAVYPEPKPLTPQTALAPDNLSLSSEFLTPGDVPSAQVEELVDAWPDCGELRPALERFGAALSRFYEGTRITEALLHGLIFPYVVTALSPEEQDDALSKAGDADGALGAAMRRLRRRLC
jgi:hypothetical protein